MLLYYNLILHKSMNKCSVLLRLAEVTAVFFKKWIVWTRRITDHLVFCPICLRYLKESFVISLMILWKINSLRACLHETRSELKPVWDFTSVWGNFIMSVHMTTGVVKLTSVQISLRSDLPKWNFKPQWVFHVNSKCPQRNKVAQNH